MPRPVACRQDDRWPGRPGPSTALSTALATFSGRFATHSHFQTIPRVEGVAAEEGIPDPAQDEALVDHAEALGVPVGAAAEVVAHHSVVGEDRQHRLLQFDLRQKLDMADIPSVGVCPESLHCDISDLHFAPFGRRMS